MIRIGMLSDTGFAMDSAFFDGVARDAVRPAGLQNGLDPTDTAVSTGTDLAAITANLSARLAQKRARGLGGVASSLRWVMHPNNATALLTLSDEARLRDTFLGVPVVSSLAVPADVTFLLDGRGIGFASDVPSFEASTEATLREDDGAPNADQKTGASMLPLATGNSGAGAITAAPVRSLFQTNDRDQGCLANRLGGAGSRCGADRHGRGHWGCAMTVAYFTRDFAAQHPGGQSSGLNVRNGCFEVRDPNSGRIERVPLHRPDIARHIASGLLPASSSRAPQQVRTGLTDAGWT